LRGYGDRPRSHRKPARTGARVRSKRFADQSSRRGDATATCASWGLGGLAASPMSLTVMRADFAVCPDNRKRWSFSIRFGLDEAAVGSSLRRHALQGHQVSLWSSAPRRLIHNLVAKTARRGCQNTDEACLSGALAPIYSPRRTTGTPVAPYRPSVSRLSARTSAGRSSRGRERSLLSAS